MNLERPNPMSVCRFQRFHWIFRSMQRAPWNNFPKKRLNREDIDLHAQAVGMSYSE
jgi:hypothetical protein